MISYIKARRYKGGITKFLYDTVKKHDEEIHTFFISEVQTGTGAEQTIAHTLGAKPSEVLIVPTLIDGDDGFTVTEGTHGSANIKVTVTSGAKFRILALK